MTTNAVVLLAWLVLAHLTADFVLQTETVATGKFGVGRPALRALLVHGLIVSLSVAPLVAVFGVVGLVAAALIAVSHVLVDRLKVVLTRRAEAEALAMARRSGEEGRETDTLGPAWTPVPAALFALDQLAHLVILALVGLVLLVPAAQLRPFLDLLDGLLGSVDRGAFHRAVLIVLVGASLLIMNVRAGSLFVGVLVGPRPRDSEAAPDRATAPEDEERPRAYTLRAGRFSARLEPDPPPGGTEMPALPSPARIGEAIGILERLVVAVLVLSRAEAAIGLVVAAKTLARFKQLDDREFAEYYLLGTLASVAVAIFSALLAGAALQAGGIDIAAPSAGLRLPFSSA